MAKVDISSIDGIDDIDKSILYMLYDDARTSFTRIAKEVGLTRPAVKNRIEAMEARGIIRGYRPVINPLPEDTGIKFMLSISADSKYYLEIASTISMFKAHREVYSKTGLSNIIAIGVVKDSREFQRYEKQVYSKISNLEGINDISLHQLITTYKDVDGGVDYNAEKFRPQDGSEGTE